MPDPKPELPKVPYVEDQDADPTTVGATAKPAHRHPVRQPATKLIVLDRDALEDEKHLDEAFIVLAAMAQTDKGLRRKRNEDRVLARHDLRLFVVADGMGGYRGGEIASSLAVETIQEVFNSSRFEGEPDDSLPLPAWELACAIQAANDAVLAYAARDATLEGMGTTICAARFSPRNHRLFVGHVGDSRMYRIRSGQIEQVTSDHTMGAFGVTGAEADQLSRAVGIWQTVTIDILVDRPRPLDTYLLCSDGLTSMVEDSEILRIAQSQEDPSRTVEDLIAAANARGGKDNIAVIVIRVLEGVPQ
jgi:PPM family protein phosphatase